MIKSYKLMFTFIGLFLCGSHCCLGQWLVQFPGTPNLRYGIYETKIVEATDHHLLAAANIIDSVTGVATTRLCKYNKNNGQIIWQRTYDFYPVGQQRDPEKAGTSLTGMIQAPNGDTYLALTVLTIFYQIQIYTPEG